MSGHTVRTVAAHHTVEGAGFEVNRAFPTPELSMVDPFLLLDQMGPSDLGPREAKGAPDHPHRGFETVTYILEGRLEHRDSHGHHGVLGPGDVQWMTAGAGVVHSEMPESSFFEAGGRMHGVQLWVNLPREDKMMVPRYQEIRGEAIPEVDVEGGTVRVIAGAYKGAEARIDTRTPISYLHAHLEPGAEATFACPDGHNGFVYVLSGRGRVGDAPVEASTLAFLPAGAVDVHAEGAMDALVITGRPLGEPVARYGPFVMNTREEVQQAITDFQEGRFGEIPAQEGGGKAYLPGRQKPA